MRWKLGSRAAVPAFALAVMLFMVSRAGAVSIDIGDATGVPGETVEITVSLATTQGEEMVAATQNDILYTPEAPIRGICPEGDECPPDELVPDCEVNPDIDKDDSQFGWRPPNCEEDGDISDCTSIRVLVVSFSNTDVIPDGPMYTCNVDIQQDTVEGTYALEGDVCGSSDPDGGDYPTVCTDGAVTVTGVTPATNTPTPSPTTATGATSTPTQRVNTPTRTGGVIPPSEDDGCQTVADTTSRSSWLLLAPLAMVLWLRRRSR